MVSIEQPVFGVQLLEYIFPPICCPPDSGSEITCEGSYNGISPGVVDVLPTEDIEALSMA